MEKNEYGIVYHDDYNKYDLGEVHPLVGDKPKKTMEYLELKGFLEKLQVFTPKKSIPTSSIIIPSFLLYYPSLIISS